MIITTQVRGKNIQVDTRNYHDLSIPLRDGNQNPNAFHIAPPSFEAFCAGGFIGSVEQGGACNCEDIRFNAHGNGTHTEGVGHLMPERYSVGEALQDTFVTAWVCTLKPQNKNGVDYITLADVQNIDLTDIDALIIRTLPNDESKKVRQYSGEATACLEPELTSYLAAIDIKHLILDLPSVDPEEDGGALQAHHRFWNYPEKTRFNATITEMAFIPDVVEDGLYLLNLQIAPFHSDASPSRPIIFPLL